ncbi:hypothetical protein FSARC_14320 [Fusarium sarcochroum]|uniref:Uncharacterized protein n=1 Tax=Fusarium sarcochroum TaxID=1208366 RepID=A0A8H4WPE6_9HYPO|nr:hypothetical protein FSARC_14320 [Fusarium sarcochroum]
MAPITENPGSEATLSSPSAAWAIIGIALNTVVQPSGSILGAPKHSRMLMRVSPLICVVNTLFTIFFLIWASWTKSFASALRAIKRLRFPPGLDSGNVPDSSFDGFRNSIWARLVSFGIGLPSLIKLYATTGIPWLYVLSSVYTASFVIDELVLFAASRVKQEPLEADLLKTTVNITHDAFRLIPTMVFWSFLVAWYFLTFVIIFSLFNIENPSIFFVAFLSVMSILPASPVFTNIRTPLSLSEFSQVLMIMSGGLFMQVGREEKSPGFIVTGVVSLGIVSLWLRPNSLWFMKLHGFVFGLVFLLLHVSIIVLYFLFLYDESATRKDSWTEKLG